MDGQMPRVASVGGRAEYARTISRPDLQILLHEAGLGARRLTRSLRLPDHDREDILHELLADLIDRLRSFAPARGTLGAFAGKLVRHRSAHIARRINRERRVFVCIAAEPFAMEDPITGTDESSLPTRRSAMLVAEHDRGTEMRIDIKRALQGLTSKEIKLCGDLIDSTPTEISRSGIHSRAGLYRSVKRIRTHMMSCGISTAA
jgi:DNA-directed RNA polymerase specialized sigma24 family protein